MESSEVSKFIRKPDFLLSSRVPLNIKFWKKLWNKLGLENFKILLKDGCAVGIQLFSSLDVQGAIFNFHYSIFILFLPCKKLVELPNLRNGWMHLIENT